VSTCNDELVHGRAHGCPHLAVQIKHVPADRHGRITDRTVSHKLVPAVVALLRGVGGTRAGGRASDAMSLEFGTGCRQPHWLGEPNRATQQQSSRISSARSCLRPSAGRYRQCRRHFGEGVEGGHVPAPIRRGSAPSRRESSRRPGPCPTRFPHRYPRRGQLELTSVSP